MKKKKYSYYPTIRKENKFKNCIFIFQIFLFKISSCRFVHPPRHGTVTVVWVPRGSSGRRTRPQGPGKRGATPPHSLNPCRHLPSLKPRDQLCKTRVHNSMGSFIELFNQNLETGTKLIWKRENLTNKIYMKLKITKRYWSKSFWLQRKKGTELWRKKFTSGWSNGERCSLLPQVRGPCKLSRVVEGILQGDHSS